jgi:hypothetical protein
MELAGSSRSVAILTSSVPTYPHPFFRKKTAASMPISALNEVFAGREAELLNRGA